MWRVGVAWVRHGSEMWVGYGWGVGAVWWDVGRRHGWDVGVQWGGAWVKLRWGYGGKGVQWDRGMGEGGATGVSHRHHI